MEVHGRDHIEHEVSTKRPTLNATQQNIAFPATLAESIEEKHWINSLAQAQASSGALASSFQDNANKVTLYQAVVLSEALREGLKST